MQVFKSVAESETNDSHFQIALNAIVSFARLGIGSFCVGLLSGIVVTIFFRFHGTGPPNAVEEAELERRAQVGETLNEKLERIVQADLDGSGVIGRHGTPTPRSGDAGDGERSPEITDAEERQEQKERLHRRHMGMHDASIFFFASLSSYYIAESLHVSGIISALVCGIICNQFAIRNMSADAQEYCRSFYVTLSEISDHILMLWVGILYYLSLGAFTWPLSLVVLGLVLLSRALSVFSIGCIVNCFAPKGRGIVLREQFMMVGAGLRGAVALALVMQMPSSSAEPITSTTLFVIFWTNVILGGMTAPLVSCLNIPNQSDGNLEESDFEFDDDDVEYLFKMERFQAHCYRLLLVHGEQNMDTHLSTIRGDYKLFWMAK